MSTILKALQRLEDEKSKGDDRSLNEQVVARRSRTTSKNRWLAICVSLLGGVAVGSSALYFWPDGGSTTPQEVAEAAPPPTTAKSRVEAAQRAVEPPAAAAGAESAAVADRAQGGYGEGAAAGPMVKVVQRLDAKSAPPPAVDEGTGAEPDTRGTNRPGDIRRAKRKAAKEKWVASMNAEENTRPAAGAVAENARTSGASAENERPAAAVSKRVPEPQEIAQPVVVAAVDPPDAPDPPREPAMPPVSAPVSEPKSAPAPEPAPDPAAVVPDPPLGEAVPNEPTGASTSTAIATTADKKVVRRAGIPEISIDKTIWHPDIERRSAIVELEESGESLELREGDAIGPLVIEAIRPSGVLFIHDGVEIEYRVGQ